MRQPPGVRFPSCLTALLIVAVGGLATLALVDRDPRWLLPAAALALLWHGYRQWLLADVERRLWLDYARAVKALNQLDERAVAVAGVAGATKIFSGAHVELDVVSDEGTARRYRGDPTGTILIDPADDAPTGGELARQSLVFADEHLGELRVRLPSPVVLRPYQAAALSAYGEALAAALHNAAADRRRRTLVAETRHAATHDPLTDLLNRAALIQQGDDALRRATAEQPVALTLIDIDNFAELNETLGHGAGDDLLRLVADRLRGVQRPGELLGRTGDDEFALLAVASPVVPAPRRHRRAGPAPHALRRARQIAELLADTGEVADVRVSAEISVGVAVAEAGTVDLAELLRRADVALHQAKADGGVASYDSVRDPADTDHLTVLAELREALATDDQLVLVVQPAVDLVTGAPIGVEALIRWQHPRRGRLGPAEFVRAVENSDLLGPFTRYVIDKALAVAAEWARRGVTVPVSVNLSPRSLFDARLPLDVAELLRHHRVPAHRLVLEITETVEVSELKIIDEVLGALQALGVQLAVDDFGTGFSSLAFLTRVAVDELKVDRSFVRRMAESPEAAAVVRATIALGRELGLRVIAEGVETAEQRQVLAGLGCAAAQGYHFFRPMPADKALTVLRRLLAASGAQVLPLPADGAS